MSLLHLAVISPAWFRGFGSAFLLASFVLGCGSEPGLAEERKAQVDPTIVMNPKGGVDPRQLLAQQQPVDVAAEQLRRARNQRIEQIKIIGEINHLTVELFKRQADPTISQADTPALIKRLKELAGKLRDN